ncbi:hypothetical protein [Aphanizomenon sp. UHCC 0183]|jgi:hypothetical protein|uniref:hypothetical protein n=1 Tax=Aphanizomenon sp. UHCC 0183 TaxID=2590028 RepID=UPI001446D59B|nr:hypothetical protein [Aphanizomenon sp. UHCC 0183]MDM3851591.1 hypothetical protein [Aphanizomenon gracile PMC627.10]MTJ28311.1 hypothetical protein [Aphanizomenon sp. UHCC 0183]
MKENLADRMLEVMSDACWHSTDELVEKVSHRFSATMHVLKKRGYQFDKRRIQGQQHEYRLVIESKAIASLTISNA